MHSEYILITSMAGSIATSALIWWWLQGALREMLNVLCDKPGSTEFWSRYTRLMLLIAPLVVAVIFTPDSQQDTTQAVRRIILAILLGHFIAFGLVGRSLFKAVNAKVTQERPIVNANPSKE